ALVYAHSIFEYHIRHYHKSNDIFSVDQHLRDTYKVVKESIALEQMLDNLRTLMSENAGIVRNTNALIESKKKLDLLLSRLQTNYPKEHVNTGLCQYRNMLAVAQVIMEQSIARKKKKEVNSNSSPNRTFKYGRESWQGRSEDCGETTI